MAFFKRPDINVFVAFLVILFGTGSWVAVNGVWSELPLIVPRLPEYWALPSYLVVIIQLANIGPFLFFIGNTIAPKKIHEVPIVYLMVVVGSIACLLLAFFWSETTVVFGEEHSTALLVLTFFLALVDCTSSIVFLPFMATLKPKYMTAYYVGEGFSGLAPGLMALGQGAGEYACVNKSSTNQTTNETTWSNQPDYYVPAFPVEHFYFFTFAMMIICGISFSLLNYLPYCKKEHANGTRTGSSNYAFQDEDQKYEIDSKDSGKVISLTFSKERMVENSEKRKELESGTITEEKETDNCNKANSSISLRHYAYLLAIIFWVNGLTNGVLTSAQTYSTLPYGPLTYSLANRLAQIANPLACFLAFFFPTRSTKIISILMIVGTVLSAYIIALAALSPHPPLMDSYAGAAISVCSWIIMVGLFSYVKLAIAELFRAEGRKALLWVGGMTQIGSLCGSITIFIIITNQVFEDAPPC